MTTKNIPRAGYTSSTSNVGISLRQKELEKQKEKDNKKDDVGLLDLLGTIGRSKKKTQEVAQIEHEGTEAMDSSGRSVKLSSILLAEMEEGEDRYFVTKESKADPKVQEIIKLLINWINDVLGGQRIVVRDIQEDLHDGLVIHRLLETLADVQLKVPDVSHTSEGQREKLNVVLQNCEEVMAQQSPYHQHKRWTAEAIHRRDLAAILQLLVALALHFRAPIRFPEHCQLHLQLVEKRSGQLRVTSVNEEIKLTTVQDEFALKDIRDAIDTLFDHAPDQLNVVRRNLLTFVNKHLVKINLEATDLETQFQDGVFLVLLMGLLEGYFVPFFKFHLTPSEFYEKVHNVGFSFDLMQDAGLERPKCRPEDVVNGDVKSTLRVLYNLYNKYQRL